MADKLRDLSPVNISFSAGDQPASSKLTGMASQIANGLATLERIIGDPLSDAHPLFSSANTPAGTWGFQTDGTAVAGTLEQRHLQIINLARLIGPASALNPRVLSDLTVTIKEPISGGQNTFKTRYAPISGVVVTDGGNNIFTSSKLNVGLVVAKGDYHVSESNGIVTYMCDQAGSPGDIEYTVDISAAYATDTYENASFNVIPDPNQATKCSVAAAVGGKYTVTLPTATHQQGNWADSSSTLDSDLDANQAQQLTLPSYWAAEFVAGNTIPDGLVKIWDGTANAFLEGQTFYYVDQSSIQVDDAVTLDGTFPNTSQYSLVVVGTDITRTLDQLRTRYHKHAHAPGDGSRPIEHKHLAGKARGSKTIADMGGGSDIIVGWIEDTSATNFNDHPQYLHRVGADSSDTKNAMFGDILFAPKLHDGTNLFHLTAPAAGSFVDEVVGCYGLRFGDDTDGPRVYSRIVNDKAIGGDGDRIELRLEADTVGGYDGRIVLDAEDRVELNATTVASGNIVMTAANDIVLNSTDDTRVLATETVNIKHGAGDACIVSNNASSTSDGTKGGILKVIGNSDASGAGQLLVQGIGLISKSGDSVQEGNDYDGVLRVDRGVMNSTHYSRPVSPYGIKFPNQILTGDDDEISLSVGLNNALTGNGGDGVFLGYQIKVRLVSDYVWQNGNDIVATWGYESTYTEDTDTLYIKFWGDSWNNETVSIVGVFFFDDD